MNLKEIEKMYRDSVKERKLELLDELNELIMMRKFFRKEDRRKRTVVKREWISVRIKEIRDELNGKE